MIIRILILHYHILVPMLLMKDLQKLMEEDILILIQHIKKIAYIQWLK
jgi:hypothetical protein